MKQNKFFNEQLINSTIYFSIPLLLLALSLILDQKFNQGFGFSRINSIIEVELLVGIYVIISIAIIFISAIKAHNK